MDLTINVDVLDKTSSAVVSASDRTELEELQLLVLGNIEPLTLRFCDDDGATPSWVTDSTTTLSVGIGNPDVDGAQLFTSTNIFTIVGSTRVGALSLSTATLRTAVYNALQCRRGSIASFTLEIRKTAPTGAIETLALLLVRIASKVLTDNPDENGQGLLVTAKVGTSTVAIDAESVTVTFDDEFSDSEYYCSMSIEVPAGQLPVSVVGYSNVTTAGFTALLSAAIPATGYVARWIAEAENASTVDSQKVGTESPAIDDESVIVSFDTAFADDPRYIAMSIEIPSGQPPVAVVGYSDVTTTGFTALLSAALPASGYTARWKAAL